MKLIAAFLAAVLLLALPAWAQAPVVAAGPALETEEQKTLYALGIWLSNRVAPLNLSAADLEFVKVGFVDGVLGHDKKVDMQAYGPKIDELAKSRAVSVATNEKKAGQAFAEKAAAAKGAVKKPSGLVYTEIKPGTGESPKATDKVKVHYRGTFIDGTTEFDSSYKRNEPAEFSLNQVIPCWTEGLGLMKVGGKSKLVCPSDIAYGDQGRPSIKPGSTLVFEVELLEIVKPEAAKPAEAK
jgi:FKBP-type peptidyl-prolyl cis-trans isomerase FkpA/FKBP-type peptidyl-prolyl cis-trans isomerase FklB